MTDLGFLITGSVLIILALGWFCYCIFDWENHDGE